MSFDHYLPILRKCMRAPDRNVPPTKKSSWKMRQCPTGVVLPPYIQMYEANAFDAIPMSLAWILVLLYASSKLHKEPISAPCVFGSFTANTCAHVGYGQPLNPQRTARPQINRNYSNARHHYIADEICTRPIAQSTLKKLSIAHKWNLKRLQQLKDEKGSAKWTSLLPW